MGTATVPAAFGLLDPFLCFGRPLEPTLLALRRLAPAAPVLIRHAGAGPRRPPRTLGGAGLRHCDWLLNAAGPRSSATGRSCGAT